MFAGCNRQNSDSLSTDEKAGEILDEIFASFDFDASEYEKTTQLTSGVIGKHAVYFEFTACDSGETVIAEFQRFTFN